MFKNQFSSFPINVQFAPYQRHLQNDFVIIVSRKTLPCRVGSLSEVGLPMFQSADVLCCSIICRICTT